MSEFNQIEFLKSNLFDNQTSEYCYLGVFDRQVLTNFRKKILTITNKDKQAQRKTFYIFIELAQNVSFYSEDRDTKENKGKGSLLVGEYENCFFFTIGNFIKNDAFSVLEKKCQIINSLDRDRLRELKRTQRNLIPGTNGGAHIGLIMVALTSKKNINMKVEKINDNISFFSIKVEIDKTKDKIKL